MTSRSGFPVEVLTATVGRDEFPVAFDVHVSPAASATNSGGLELRSVPADSPLEHAGFKDGDIVLAVNGYAATDPAWLADADRTNPSPAYVVELMRRGRPVVLVITRVFAVIR